MVKLLELDIDKSKLERQSIIQMGALNNIDIVAQQVFKIEDWMIKDDGGLVLQEKEIKREKKVRICVNSKELTHHNRPHIHAYYEDKEYSIAIDENYDLLAPPNRTRSNPLSSIGYFLL